MERVDRLSRRCVLIQRSCCCRLSGGGGGGASKESAAAEQPLLAAKLAGGCEVRCTGEWVDLDVAKMAFTFLQSCSYKVLRELEAHKINSY